MNSDNYNRVLEKLDGLEKKKNERELYRLELKQQYATYQREFANLLQTSRQLDVEIASYNSKISMLDKLFVTSKLSLGNEQEEEQNNKKLKDIHGLYEKKLISFQRNTREWEQLHIQIIDDFMSTSNEIKKYFHTETYQGKQNIQLNEEIKFFELEKKEKILLNTISSLHIKLKTTEDENIKLNNILKNSHTKHTQLLEQYKESNRNAEIAVSTYECIDFQYRADLEETRKRLQKEIAYAETQGEKARELETKIEEAKKSIAYKRKDLVRSRGGQTEDRLMKRVKK